MRYEVLEVERRGGVAEAPALASSSFGRVAALAIDPVVCPVVGIATVGGTAGIAGMYEWSGAADFADAER